MVTDWLPVALPARLRIGTSSYSWNEWHGPFYPPDLPARERLTWYAQQFSTVEVDATFYRAPTRQQVSAWAERTPPEFTFALKVPRAITHEAALEGTDAAVGALLEALAPLGPRQGPLLLQFAYVAKGADAEEYASGARFLRRLTAWLDTWHGAADWVVEVRNQTWLAPPLLDLLRAHGVPLALTAYYTMPTLAAQLAGDLDPLTGAFAYVRFLGDHRRLDRLNEELVAAGRKPPGYSELIIDRDRELRGWVDALAPVLSRRPAWVYFNNHYAGFGPGSARAFARLWDEIHGG